MDIPWGEKSRFEEAVGFLEVMDRQMGQDLYPVRELARDIRHGFDGISDELDRRCRLTCPDCSDNCCARATIWYDFRDLLYLYFSPGRMPGCQILKDPGISCPNLKHSGCMLPRSRRPFVCTWYSCPAQKSMPSGRLLSETILNIKEMRIRMEDEFCRITAG